MVRQHIVLDSTDFAITTLLLLLLGLLFGRGICRLVGRSGCSFDTLRFTSFSTSRRNGFVLLAVER